MKKILLSLILLVLFLPGLVMAAEPKNLQNAFNTGGEDSPLDDAGLYAGYNIEQDNIDPIISNTISIVLSFLGVIFLLLAIRAGYLWMTAQGDAKKVEEAKDILTRAVIGLIVVVSAYSISAYVIGTFAPQGLSGEKIFE